MLQGELVQEFVGWHSSAGLDVLKTPSHAFHRLLVVLMLPLEVIPKGVIEGIGGALPTPAGVFLELRESFGFDR
jgi:hypothetical protein